MGLSIHIRLEHIKSVEPGVLELHLHG